jgi:hypothetical protein
MRAESVFLGKRVACHTQYAPQMSHAITKYSPSPWIAPSDGHIKLAVKRVPKMKGIGLRMCESKILVLPTINFTEIASVRQQSNVGRPFLESTPATICNRSMQL